MSWIPQICPEYHKLVKKVLYGKAIITQIKNTSMHFSSDSGSRRVLVSQTTFSFVIEIAAPSKIRTRTLPKRKVKMTILTAKAPLWNVKMEQWLCKTKDFRENYHWSKFDVNSTYQSKVIAISILVCKLCGLHFIQIKNCHNSGTAGRTALKFWIFDPPITWHNIYKN